MSTIITEKIKKWLPILQICILSFGTLVSFITSYFTEKISLYLPFVSETGAYTPAKSIFSLFLIVGSFIGCINVFFIFITFSSISENKVKCFMNILSAVIGIISMFGLAGVAAFPMTTIFWAHLVAATIYFAGSALYFMLITFITLKVFGNNYIFKIRVVLSATITVLLILISIIFPLSLGNWHKKNEIIPALKEPKHEGFTLIFISSILEWSIVLIIVAFTTSFMKELGRTSIVIMIHPEECKKDATEDSPENESTP